MDREKEEEVQSRGGEVVRWRPIEGFCQRARIFRAAPRLRRLGAREWAPNAEQIFLVGDFNGWRELPEFKLRKIEEWGVWELRLLSHEVNHGDHYLLKVYWPGGSGLAHTGLLPLYGTG